LLLRRGDGAEEGHRRDREYDSGFYHGICGDR
jgi:hypothetical protein